MPEPIPRKQRTKPISLVPLTVDDRWLERCSGTHCQLSTVGCQSMNRIILGMAGANYLLVAITIYFGLRIIPADEAAAMADVSFEHHFSLGILTALFTMLVHCMVFTYFLGTSRWVKEATQAYSLDLDYSRRSQGLRGRSMRCVVLSIFLTLAALITGPMAHRGFVGVWVHPVCVAAAYLFMLLAY